MLTRHSLSRLLLGFGMLTVLNNSMANDGHNRTITYLGIEQGLSNNAVRCVFQDHKGFMWFGTYDGLNRYDGNSFKVYRNNFSDSSSLVNNWVLTINEDGQQHLWIGTRQGLNIYNAVSEKFSMLRYQVVNSGELKTIRSVIRDIKRNSLGDMLVATAEIGLLFVGNGQQVARQIPLMENGKPVYNYDASMIDLSATGDGWFFAMGKGLCKFDSRTGQAKLVNIDITTVTCIKGYNDFLWIGTPNGLFKYHIPSNQYRDSFTEANGKLTYNKVSNLFLENNGELWIAINGGGINILNAETGAVIEDIGAGSSNTSLTSESVNAIYEDAGGRKWIGTLRGGINIIDPRKNRFQGITHDPVNANSLVSNFVFALCEETNGDIWIGTDGGGISRWDRKANRFLNFAHHPGQPGSLSDNFVTNIKCDDDQNIWVATYWGGLNRFNKSSNTFKHYALYNSNTTQENKTVYLLYKDKLNQIWAGTISGNGLFKYNRQTDAFELFDNRLADLLTMQEDMAGEMWAGNLKELIRIDRQTKKHQSYLLGNPVRAIHEDRNGKFWIGTEGGGLVLFDREKGKVIERYTTNEGLTNNAVLNILEDNAGNLWISTFNGLSRFNTQTRTFTNYYIGDGLQGNQFNYNAALTLRSGEMMFGGIKGLDIFHPEAIRASDEKPNLLFTGLTINNLPIGQRPDYIKHLQNDEIKVIEVPYRDAVFTFEFTALDYSTPNKIFYSYYMDGWDKGWNKAGNKREATYTHLGSGTYKFRVRSTDTEGRWLDREISLEVIVLPPWYASWWAYCIYLSVAGGIIALYVAYKQRQRKLQYEVALARMNAEKERELNEKKLSFFTNVSHEFRTPLTLIINPIKDMMARKEGNADNRYELNTVYRNAKRLLRLLDQLLLFRKADSELDRIKPTELNFSELCRDVFLSFMQQARLANIEYLFFCDKEDLRIYGDREKLEIILFNLLSNALKYTPPDGKVTFRLQEFDKTLEVVIEDTGVGIPAGTAAQLFEKFYRPAGAATSGKPGFGIGLYLVKQFTVQHGGQVSYESAAGKGTTFKVVLPKGTERVSSEPAIQLAPQETGFLEEMTDDVVEETKTAQEEGAVQPIIDERQSMLVVDDDPQIRSYVAAMFQASFHVEEAGDGKEALEKAEALIPDIIISDIKMQEQSGIDLCRSIKENPTLNHIPVILLTGTSSEESKLQSAEVGADDYITKPFEKELLVARVQGVLQTRDNLRKYFLNAITHRQNDFKVSGQYKQFLEKCIAVVEQNLENDDFTIQTLAREMGMSHSSVYKKIKTISGESLRGFVRFIRLRKAAELMINTNLNVSEIGFQVGINDVKYFRVQFNKVFKMNPSEYIRRYRKPFEDKYNMDKIEKKK